MPIAGTRFHPKPMAIRLVYMRLVATLYEETSFMCSPTRGRPQATGYLIWCMADRIRRAPPVRSKTRHATPACRAPLSPVISRAPVIGGGCERGALATLPGSDTGIPGYVRPWPTQLPPIASRERRHYTTPPPPCQIPPAAAKPPTQFHQKPYEITPAKLRKMLRRATPQNEKPAFLRRGRHTFVTAM